MKKNIQYELINLKQDGVFMVASIYHNDDNFITYKKFIGYNKKEIKEQLKGWYPGIKLK